MDRVWKADREYRRVDLAVVDFYLRVLSEERSRSQIQRWIEQGLIRVSGTVAGASQSVQKGEKLTWSEPAAVAMSMDAVFPVEGDLEILFEDEDLAIVNKPPGISVHPSESEMAKGPTTTLVHLLLGKIKHMSGVGGVLRPGIVHRIDKWTSGSLVVSKNDWTHQKLSELFAAHDIQRAYWALAYGVFKGSQKVESLLGRSTVDRKKISSHVRNGRHAESHFKSLAVYGHYASWIEARLKTGRTHQIRVHLADLGHSILADPTYGIPSAKHPKWLALPEEIRELVAASPGQALHARTLGFVHPRTGASIEVQAEPPASFSVLLKALEKTKEAAIS